MAPLGPMLPCDGLFFGPGPVPYNNTCVHAKFEANLCTWAASSVQDCRRVPFQSWADGCGRLHAVRSRGLLDEPLVVRETLQPHFVRQLRGTSRPGLHGPRCARLTSILGLSGTVEHAGVASRMSFVDPRRSPFSRAGAGHARSQSEARSGQFESPWTRRGPRRPRCPVGCGVYFSPRATEAARPAAAGAAHPVCG